MITDTRQCSCEGTNPDCFRCNGTGMIPQRATNRKAHSEAYKSAVSVKKRSGKSRAKSSPINKTTESKSIERQQAVTRQQIVRSECPVCKIKVETKYMQDHIITMHKNEYLKKQHAVSTDTNISFKKVKSNKAIINKQLVKCDICNNYIKPRKIIKHKIECAIRKKEIESKLKNKKSVIVNVKSNKVNNANKLHVKCSKCRVLIQGDKLKEHYIECDGKLKAVDIVVRKSLIAPTKKKIDSNKLRCISEQNILTGSKRKTSINSRQNKTTTSMSVDKSKNEPRGYMAPPKSLDATYGTHRFRDSGRFGSQPSYDNYDDESTP